MSNHCVDKAGHMMATFAGNLNRLMDEQGLSAWRLSVLAGVSESSIGYWRRGQTLPNNVNLERLAKALGVGLWELMEEEKK